MLRSISERFNVGRSTALKITRRVVSALIELAPIVIKWPTNEQINQVWTGFEATSGFPKVIGSIDGTHINIPKIIQKRMSTAKVIIRFNFRYYAVLSQQ